MFTFTFLTGIPTTSRLGTLYATKEDEDFIQSAGHPDLANSGPPRTMAASQARAKRRQPTAGFHDSATDSAMVEEKFAKEVKKEIKKRAALG